MSARIGDLLDDARTLDLLTVLELCFEHGVARRGHWKLFHKQVLNAPLRRGRKFKSRADISFP